MVGRRARLIERWAAMAWQPRPSAAARALQPLAWPMGLLAALHRAWWQRVRRPTRLPVPVVVVGNLVVGGSGKTPVVIAVVQALRAAGWTPGVVSRGYGRTSGDAARLATTGVGADEIGDEPVLIQRRTGAALAVGARRVDAARLLLARHPEVDLIVSDDGLQHHALAHDLAIVVFDDRGAGNGLGLPAGPLREPLPAAVPRQWLVLYTGRAGASTPLPGTLATLQAGRAVALEQWRGGRADIDGKPLESLRSVDRHGRPPLLALAGIGHPSKFFATLTAAGLHFTPQPMPDHAHYERAPWPDGTSDVVTTEKDAVKLASLNRGATRVWVVPLDLTLPSAFVTDLLHRLPPRRKPA